MKIRARFGYDAEYKQWNMIEAMTDGEWEAGGEWKAELDLLFSDFRELWVSLDDDKVNHALGERAIEGEVDKEGSKNV